MNDHNDNNIVRAVYNLRHTAHSRCFDFLPPGNPVRLTLNLVLYLARPGIANIYCNYCNGHMGYKENKEYFHFGKMFLVDLEQS